MVNEKDRGLANLKKRNFLIDFKFFILKLQNNVLQMAETGAFQMTIVYRILLYPPHSTLPSS